MKQLKLSGVDCESPADFSQYYRGRYFGLPNSEGGVLPTQLVLVEGGTCHCHVMQSKDKVEEKRIRWADLRQTGLFGRPTLGLKPYGDGYRYLWDFARRESIKGFDIRNIQKWTPDNYGLKMLQDKVFKAPRSEEVWNVYNPVFYTWRDAISLLESGAKIGTPVTDKLGLYLKLGSPYIHVSYKYNAIGHLEDEHNLLINRKFSYLEDIVVNILPNEVKVSHATG